MTARRLALALALAGGCGGSSAPVVAPDEPDPPSAATTPSCDEPGPAIEGGGVGVAGIAFREGGCAVRPALERALADLVSADVLAGCFETAPMTVTARLTWEEAGPREVSGGGGGYLADPEGYEVASILVRVAGDTVDGLHPDLEECLGVLLYDLPVEVTAPLVVDVELERLAD